MTRFSFLNNNNNKNNKNKGEGVPTCVDFVNNEKTRVVASFGTTHHNVYDVETSRVVSRFDYLDSTASMICLNQSDDLLLI